jgi:hypothetical protein
MANHIPFDIEENEIELLARMGDRMVDQARMFDPGSTASENLPEGVVRLNLSARKFEKLGPGGLWSDALDYLAMKVNELTGSGVLQVLQAAYPVGSVYINADVDTNPNMLLGFGTWLAIGSGRVLVGKNTGDALFGVLGETGGSKDSIVVSHSHSVSDPGHTHAVNQILYTRGVENGSGEVVVSQFNDGGSNIGLGVNSVGTGISIQLTGSNGTNANLQPYLVVKMWKRTA